MRSLLKDKGIGNQWSGNRWSGILLAGLALQKQPPFFISSTLRSRHPERWKCAGMRERRIPRERQRLSYRPSCARKMSEPGLSGFKDSPDCRFGQGPPCLRASVVNKRYALGNQSAEQANPATSYLLPLTNHTFLRSTVNPRLGRLCVLNFHRSFIRKERGISSWYFFSHLCVLRVKILIITYPVRLFPTPL